MSTYWLGNSHVYNNTSYLRYGIRCVYNGAVTGSILFGSHDYWENAEAGIRPVVTLEKNISVENSGQTKDGCTIWNIE